MTTNNKTILLVDDEEATRNQICHVLQGGGYNVLMAKDYGEAIAAFQRRRGEIDLLLTDVSLPGLSGCELSIALREEDKGLRVLLMSGYSGAELLQFYGVHLTDAHFLQKPFRPVDLLERVASLLERFGSASA
jgi:DNA-binding response OmpR family regulator